MGDLDKIKKSFLAEIDKAEGRDDLEKLRVKYLGREKGLLTAILRSLGGLPLAKRRKIGPEAQGLKKEMEKILSNRTEVLRAKSQESRVRVDLTAPGKKVSRGRLHPLTLVDEETRKIFLSMGFSVVEGPEAETEYYNFDALNIPANHPARDMWDTFWVKETRDKRQETRRQASHVAGRLLLRTHTSPVQIRYMEEHNPPFQIIVPGRVFRYEATDASHEINFHQLEGLMVGKNITLANFKFVVEEFFKRFFRGQKIDFRYRPSYFPFVEPGLEVDIRLAGSRKPVAGSRQSAWLEVMGAGMVHPRVFEYAHYNPRDWQGFAFGMGIDRLAMIKYKIPDIRMFYSGDLRIVKQF